MYRVHLGSRGPRRPAAAAALVSAVGPVDGPRVRHFGVLDTAETVPVRRAAHAGGCVLLRRVRAGRYW
jgi:hypothetical protein